MCPSHGMPGRLPQLWGMMAFCFHKYPKTDVKDIPTVILSHHKFSEGKIRSPLSVHALGRPESLGTHSSSTQTYKQNTWWLSKL